MYKKYYSAIYRENIIKNTKLLIHYSESYTIIGDFCPKTFGPVSISILVSSEMHFVTGGSSQVQNVERLTRSTGYVSLVKLDHK